MAERTKPRHCSDCGNFAGSAGRCNRCRQLNDERLKRLNAEVKVRDLEVKVRSLMRYTVHHGPGESTGGPRTFNDAIGIAKEWVGTGVKLYSASVVDERGVVVKRYENRGGSAVEVSV